MRRPPSSPIPIPPRQERSRAKLERVLVAAEELLGTRLFEDLSISAIAAHAGVSVGTIYTRFRTKDDLLPALFARHDAAVGPRVRALVDDLGGGRDLRSRIDRLVAFAVDYHRRYRGLLRALTMYVRAHPASVPAEVFRARSTQYRAVAEALIGDGAEVVARRGESAVDTAEFAVGLVNSVCREQLLFDDVTPLRGRRRLLAATRGRIADTVHLTLAAPLP